MKRKITIFVTALLCISGSLYAQHSPQPVTPGSMGEIPEFQEPSKGQDGVFPGLRLDYTTCYVSPFSYIRPEVNLKFPTPDTFGGESYVLQCYEDGKWTAFGDSDNPYIATGDNFSIYIYGPATFRLLLSGGAKDGWVSNSVSVSPFTVPTRLSSWGFGYNRDPYVGVEATSTDATVTLEYENNYTEQQILDSFKYKWYRRNPNTYETIQIPGADGPTYIPTLEDVGYYLVSTVSGDDVITSFCVEDQSENIVKFPVYCSFDYLDTDGLILNTSHVIPSYSTSLSLGYEDWEDGYRLLPYAMESVEEVMPGQYKMRGNIDFSSFYLLVLYQGGNSPVRLVAKYGDGTWSMIREVITRLDETLLCLTFDNFDIMENGWVTLYAKNIDGEYVGKMSMDAYSDTIEVYAPNNKYYIKAQSAGTDMATTYYPSATVWSEAQLVDATSFDSYGQCYTFNLQRPVFVGTGVGVIEGCISNPEVAETRALLTGSGIQGVSVLLLNSDNKVVSSTTTDYQGNFRFEQLANGTYYVVPDCVGYSVTSPLSVTLSASAGAVSGLDYTMQGNSFVPSSATAVKSAVTDNEAQMQYDLSGRSILPSANGIHVSHGVKWMK